MSMVLDDCYLKPEDGKTKTVVGSHDSGVESLSSSGNVNPSFLASPESELETSFSDEQKLSSGKPYVPPKSKKVMASGQLSRGPASVAANTDLELNLPPPPGNMWAMRQDSAPETAHSADGVLGYPYNSPNYIYTMGPQRVHPSMQSLPNTGGITAEEQQLILRYRQDKFMRSQNLNSPATPDSENGNLYEEVPGYFYKTHNQLRLKNSVDGKLPPHLPPISSMPSGSLASINSDLTALDEETFAANNASGLKNSNPLYGVNESNSSYSNDRDEAKEEIMKSKSSLESQLQSDRSINRCYCVALMLVGLLASASLILTLLTATGTINMSISKDTNTGKPVTAAATVCYNSSNPELNSLINFLIKNVTELSGLSQAQTSAMDELNAEISNLRAINTDLEIRLNQTSVDLRRTSLGATEQFSFLNNSLLSVDNLLLAASSDLILLNMTLTHAVNEVSKTPGPKGDTGPQGPAGLLNTSLCAYTYHINLFDSASNGTSRSAEENDQFMIIGASCGQQGFGYAVLSRRETSSGHFSYQCKCGKGLTDATNLACNIYYWKCTVS